MFNLPGKHTESEGFMIEEKNREQIAAFLPDAIRRALTSYEAFSGNEVSVQEANAFKDHHNACKVAIAHIELLLKLARWADLPDETAANKNDQVILAAMMETASEELQNYRTRHPLSPNKPE